MKDWGGRWRVRELVGKIGKGCWILSGEKDGGLLVDEAEVLVDVWS